MIANSPLPAGWRVVAFPTGWISDQEELRIRSVTIDYVTYPDSFTLVIQSEKMMAEEEPTGIIANFKASEADGVEMTQIFGLGPRWAEHLGEVAREFPPELWTKQAKTIVVQFLQMPEVRKAFAESLGKLPRMGVDSASGRPDEPGVQRRRKLTPEHLAEVARIYEQAVNASEPPTRAVQKYFNVAHSTAAKWVGAARRADLLPPV